MDEETWGVPTTSSGSEDAKNSSDVGDEPGTETIGAVGACT